MLRQLRGATRGWVSGVFLFIMAALFVIFLGSGNSTIFDAFLHPAGANNLATVGGVSITPNQLDREIELTLRRMRNNGQDVSRSDAIGQGLHLQLLQNLIERRAVADYAKRLGIVASDAQVANAIREAHVAENPLTGTFDRGRYLQFLQEIRYSQPEFEQEQRNDIASTMVLDAMTTGTRAPASFGALLLAYESERRMISVAAAPAALVGNVAPPTDAQLQAYYQELAQALRTPEYRTLTLVFARPADFAARVTVPEDRIRQEFESRRASLTTPEKRTFVQISAPDQARAQQAATRLGQGEAPDAVAHALGLQFVRSADVARDAVPDPNVANAVFGMARGAAPAAVRGSLSPWVAVKLEAITPAVEPSYAAQHDAIRDELARSDASDQLNDAMDGFETARSAGTSIADAARANHLTVVNVPAVDQRGMTPEGQPAEALVDQPRLIQTAFQTNEGEVSEFMPLGDNGYALLSVDHIRPPSTRPLAEVRPQLTQAWIARERGRRLDALATQVKEAVAQGQPFAAAARAKGLTMAATSQPVFRQNVQQSPIAFMAAEIFGAHPGEVVSATRPDGAGMLVAIVEDISHVQASQAPQRVEQNRQQIQQSLGESAFEAIASIIVDQAKPKRNEAQIRAFAEQAQGQTPQQPQ